MNPEPSDYETAKLASEGDCIKTAFSPSASIVTAGKQSPLTSHNLAMEYTRKYTIIAHVSWMH